MGTSEGLVCISRVAGADLSTHQYKWVKLNSAGKVVIAGAGEDALGILQNKPGNGETATIAVRGVSLLKVASAVAVGLVASAANGFGEDVASTNYILGRALEPATAANQHISVLVLCAGAVKA